MLALIDLDDPPPTQGPPPRRRLSLLAIAAALLLLLLTAGAALRAGHTAPDNPAVPASHTGHGGGHPKFQ